MGVSLGVDVSKLDLCFGGFSPTVMGDGIATSERVEQSERRLAARREALERAAAIEAARASEVCDWCDEAGNRWEYVVLDGAEVRIEGCEAAGARLDVPMAVAGLPVVALAADACAFLPLVEEATCPDTVLSIGFCAFRGNKALRRVRLPRNLATFDSGWFRNCPRLESLVLPGAWDTLDASIFDVPALKRLLVGPGTAEVAPGAFGKSCLESIEVDEGNPYLATDGRALYSKEGSALVALAVPGPAYRVREGCRILAKKALSTFEDLVEVELPDSVEVVGEYAFSRTGVATFTAPMALEAVLERAFFDCAHLTQATLGDKLRYVGDHAFTGTAVEELRLPATVEGIGHPLADGTGLTYAGPDATFSIAAGSERLLLDEHGGLYREQEDGHHLVRMMDPRATAYEVAPGTIAIDDGAFFRHPAIAEVALPASLRRIGAAAFRDCRSLARADFPEGLESIGDEAFLDTVLERASIPAGLMRIGERALVTHGAHHGKVPPTLRDMEVAPGNGRFRMESGLLLERLDDGRTRVVHFTDAVERVAIPPEVTVVAPYAFNGARNLRELALSDRITEVGIRGLAIDCLLDRIHVDLVEPVGGHDSLDVRFPATDRGTQQMKLAFSVPDRVSVRTLLEHYDNAILNGSSFDVETEQGLDLYEQVTRIIARLLDPVCMLEVNRSMAERFLASNIEPACVAIARHDDRRSIDALLDLGFLNEGNLYAVIEKVGAVQDAAMTGYLLEAKRQRFGGGGLDFDL